MPLIGSQIIRLFEELEDKEQKLDPNCHLKAQISNIYTKAEHLLSRVYDEFREFTDHTITHKNRVLKNLELIMPDSLLNDMNIYELFFLISSIYLHDIGMADIKGLKKYAVPKGAKRFEFIRKYHHLRTKEFIINNHEYLGLDEIDAKIIANICSGHRIEDLLDSTEFSLKLSYRTNHTLNIALLSLLLRIADELDLTYERTPKILLDFLDIESPESKIEWERHNSTIGIAKDPEDPVTIVCSADCNNPEIYRSLKKIEDKINHELNYIPELIGFHRRPDIMREIPRKFRTKINAEGFQPYDFKFSVDRTAIFNLLGNQLYHYDDETVREALKNAIDSCRYRREVTESDYEPKIKVIYDKKMKQLIIEDNGIGMNEQHVKNYLTVIGKSLYSSSDFKNSQHNFDPLSELGIGILSYFVLADEIEIDTKFKNSKALRIVIDNSLDYFLVYDGSRTEDGTKLVFHLKNIHPRINESEELNEFTPRSHLYYLSRRGKLLDKSGQSDYLKILRYYLKHVEFPIVYKQDSQTTVIKENDSLAETMMRIESIGRDLVKIGNEMKDKEHQGYFNSAFRSVKKDYELKKIPGLSLTFEQVNKDGLRGYVGIILAKDETGRLIPWSDLPSMFLPLPRPSLSINGIHIPAEIFDDRFTYGERFWYDLDLGFKLKLDTSRNYIIDRSGRWGLTTRILSHICKLIKEQVQLIGTVDNDQKYNINNDLLYLLLHSKGFTLEIPFVTNLFKKYLIYRCISKNRIHFLNAKQVKQDTSVVLVYLPESLDDPTTEKIVRENPKFLKTKKYILNPYYELGNQFIGTIERSGIRNFIQDDYYNKLFKHLELGPTTTKKFKEYNI